MSLLLSLVLATLLTSLLVETLYPLSPVRRAARLKALTYLSLAVALVLTLHTSLISTNHGNTWQVPDKHMGGSSNDVIADYCLHHKPKCRSEEHTSELQSH